MKRIGLIILAMFASGMASAQTLKVATAMPEGSEWMTDMRASAAEIKERTDGRVVIKYYGGGSMGSDSQVLKRISMVSEYKTTAYIASAQDDPHAPRILDI